MSFASFQFIFLFLPLTCLAFWWIQRFSVVAALWSLSIASFFFYIAWDPRDILVAGTSIAFNYYVARKILENKLTAGRWLKLAIVVNLAALIYFKYLYFIASQFEQLTGSPVFHIRSIALPLGVSFFTFTQIAYLVDCYSNKIRRDQHGARDYILFVTFFPHLIAGPILHHKQIIPQFHRDFRENAGQKFHAGVVMFVVGLAKKVLLADHLAKLANPSFDAAAKGIELAWHDAWIGITSYTLQLYFDFSGYSDMAVGAALMVGVMIPFNFASPYRATSIIEFWKRWHISLSTFLRDYLYIPLGGNRGSTQRRYINIFTTMLLGGIWHGAGLGFIVWGFLHGLFIVVNHAWRDFAVPRLGTLVQQLPYRMIAYALTLSAVMLGWVFFRASDITSAVSIIQSASGLGNSATPLVRSAGVLPTGLLIAIGAAVAACPINSLAIHDRLLDLKVELPRAALMFICGIVFFFGIIFISEDSPFLYFQF